MILPPKNGYRAELFGAELEPLVAPPHADGLISLLHEIDTRFAGDPFRPAELALRLGGWLLCYDRARVHGDDPHPLGWASPVQHAEALMRESLDKPHTVTELAALVGLSRSHFVRRYTAVRGRGPGAYLEDQRLAEAQLREGGRTVRPGRRPGRLRLRPRPPRPLPPPPRPEPERLAGPGTGRRSHPPRYDRDDMPVRRRMRRDRCSAGASPTARTIE